MRKISFITLVFTFFLVVAGTNRASHVAAEAAFQTSPESTGAPLTQVPDSATPEPNSQNLITTTEMDREAMILEDGWQFPINLSQSGASSDPQLVIDSSGISHVLWSDDAVGFGYTFGDDDSWSKPVAVEYPFFTRRYFPDLTENAPTPIYRPVLAADANGYITAFWIGDKGVIFYSSVPSTEFSDFGAWSPRAAFGASGLSLASAAGSDGRIHVAYIRPEESEAFPAGIYYRRLEADGTLPDATMLYASRYLRSVPPESSNVQIITTDSGSLYIVWADTLKEQVYFSKSNDDGLTWDPPREIDRRESGDADSASGPNQIAIGTINDELHLTWLAGHEPGYECRQYVSRSNDDGATWTAREAVATLPRCFVSAQFVAADGTLLMLGTTEEEDVADLRNTIVTTYFLAWDGNRWSEPQIQEALARFSNVETNQAVHLGCHYGFGEGSRISLLGCDTAEGGDIWLMGRETGEMIEWFPPPPIWQEPEEVSGGGSMPAEARLVNSNESIYAFWNEGNSPLIYYSSLNGEHWSPGQEVVTSGDGDVTYMVATGAVERLFLAWKDSVLGLQFSAASADNPSQWTDPVTLVPEQPEASSPSITADAGGNLFIAFSIELNESRGVYLIHSADAGETWSKPVQIFDGAAAGWNMVDDVVLTQTKNGQLHLMWTRRSLPPESKPLEMAYSRSEDLGQTWSEAETVVETQSLWSTLVGAGERSVHRLWSEDLGARQIVWHEFSLDGGLTWSQAEQIMGLDKADALSTVVDPALQPHLLTLANGQLSDQVWVDGRWNDSEGSATNLTDGGSLDATASQDGRMAVAYSVNLGAENAAEEENRLYGMWRMLDLPQGIPTPLPTLTPTRAAITPTATATALPTATVFFSTEQEQSGLGEIPGMSGLPVNVDLIVAFIPVLLIIGLGILIGIRIIRKQ